MSVQVLASTDICWYKTVETIDCPSDSWASIARVTPISDASNIVTDFFGTLWTENHLSIKSTKLRLLICSHSVKVAFVDMSRTCNTSNL